MGEEQLEASKTRFLYEKIVDNISHSIKEGIYLSSDRIPSVRQMSQQNGVSITTVLQAYQRLEELGLIESRPQSGYYVAPQIELNLPEPEISTPSKDPSLVSLHDLIMMILRDTQNSELVQLGAALPNLEFMPVEQLNKLFLSIFKNSEREIYQ